MGALGTCLHRAVRLASVSSNLKPVPFEQSKTAALGTSSLRRGGLIAQSASSPSGRANSLAHLNLDTRRDYGKNPCVRISVTKNEIEEFVW